MADDFTLRCVVNGSLTVLDDVPHSELLLDVLRDRLGLTGAKRSCDVEVCGACTVLLDGLPVSACTTLAWEAREVRIDTVEGLASEDRLHRLQRAFVDTFSLQCGFCIPGMLMGAKHLLDEVAEPDRQAIRRYLDGNLCRCTGYASIVEAVESASREGGSDA